MKERTSIRVGCCGFSGIKGGIKRYYAKIDVVELQQTFYQLPRIETAEKWLEEARRVNENFEFTMKAWQAITHSPKSPTWRRCTEKPRKDYGDLRASSGNLEAWRRTIQIGEKVEAKIVVIQTPASFGFSQQNVQSINEFFDAAERTHAILGWEPRGNWRNHEEAVKRICSRNSLIHICDPFRWRVLTGNGPVYYRLHGIGPEDVNYSYRFSSTDLRKLAEKVRSDLKTGRPVYVMFNNITMASDATLLNKILASKLAPDHKFVKAIETYSHPRP